MANEVYSKSCRKLEKAGRSFGLNLRVRKRVVINAGKRKGSRYDFFSDGDNLGTTLAAGLDRVRGMTKRA